MHGTGFAINIGMERRLEYRLSFPIINKLHKVHQRLNLYELSKNLSIYKIKILKILLICYKAESGQIS